MSASQVSFTIRRPTTSSPLARNVASSSRPTRTFHRSNDSSDDEDERDRDELVTSFDQFSVERSRTPQNQSPLIIPPLQNRDWRELAKKRRGGTRFVPASAAVPTGADGSVGGLGTRDTIGTGPAQAGLQTALNSSIKQERAMNELTQDTLKNEPDPATDDEKAIRAILASANGEISHTDGPLIDIIPLQPGSISEADAFQQDIHELPDVSTLEDYARIPVSQFGAALLRGMGWKEGTAASLTRQGPVEPYLPEARPALLGIGAKPMEEVGEGRAKRPDMKYVPVVKRAKETGREGSRDSERDGDRRNGSGRSSRRRTPESRHGSTPSSRRTSRSPPRRDRDRDRDSQREREGGRRERDVDSEKDQSRRRYDYGYADKERSRRRGDR
jgi:hypothetical protein